MSLQSAAASDKRSGPAKVSLLPQYGPQAKSRKKDRKAPAVVAITIDDPWPDSAPAFLKEPPKKTAGRNGHVCEWIVPVKKPIEVLASRRDVIAGMYARGQMGKPEFFAARDYAQTFATAMALPVKGVDPSAPVVSGGNNGHGAIDAVMAAGDRLKRIERGLSRAYGEAAVRLVRDVVGRGLTIEKATLRAMLSACDPAAVRWRGGLLRESLKELAELCGYAVRGAYANRGREERRRERIVRDQEHRDRERKQRGKARQAKP
jgi:hypothetical protein